MFNGKAESKTKKMIITKVVWYLFPEKKGTVVLRKGTLGGPLGSSSQTIKMWDRTFQEEEAAGARTCRPG